MSKPPEVTEMETMELCPVFTSFYVPGVAFVALDFGTVFTKRQRVCLGKKLKTPKQKRKANNKIKTNVRAC